MGTQEQGYQGWANWDTWAVALNLLNDEGAYHATKGWFEEAAGDRDALADVALERFEVWMTDEVDADEVDWLEVADAIIEAWE